MKKPSYKWRKKAEVYRVFAQEDAVRLNMDFSEQAALECFEWESQGRHKEKYSESVFTAQKTVNGYVYGKKVADQTVEMWRGNPSKPYPFCYGDIQRGQLTVLELYEDPVFKPHWDWLDKVLNGLPRLDTNLLRAVIEHPQRPFALLPCPVDPRYSAKQQIGAR